MGCIMRWGIADPGCRWRPIWGCARGKRFWACPRALRRLTGCPSRRDRSTGASRGFCLRRWRGTAGRTGGRFNGPRGQCSAFARGPSGVLRLSGPVNILWKRAVMGQGRCGPASRCLMQRPRGNFRMLNTNLLPSPRACSRARCWEACGVQYLDLFCK